jgi:predicted metalloprotease with PDZ domain
MLLRFAGLLITSIGVFAQAPVRYEISFPNAAHHEARVRATFEDIPTPTLEVLMSRSSPGRYALHEFARNIYRVQAKDGKGKPLAFERPTPHQWNISGHDGVVSLEYTLYGDIVDGTYNGIDETHGHLNAPAALMWARGFEKRPALVKLIPPKDSKWKVATQLEPVADNLFRARDLDYLLDSPFEISDFILKEWKTGGQHFRLALHHTGTEAEATAFARMCEAIVVESEGVFGEYPKFDHGTYTFLSDYLPKLRGGDGMEHRNSTVIASRGTLAENGPQMAGTVAHEFFHVWNVERIRPKTLEPFNFEEASMTGELWFAEGFTTYYTPLLLKRAGLTSIDKFLQTAGGTLSSVLNSPGREVFSAVEMSQLAPFIDGATTREPRNLENTVISYYPYGAAIGLGIDLTIRTRFPGKSLDDWMRTMWVEHGKSERPYTLMDLERTLASVTTAEFASEVFRRHIRGKEQMDYAGLLERAGIVLRKTKAGEGWLGRAAMRYSNDGAEITGATLVGSPLYEAGLDRDDRIVELAGRPLKQASDLEAAIKGRKPGDVVKAKVEKRTGQREIEIKLGESPEFELVTSEAAGRTLSPSQTSLREAWLSSKAKQPLPELRKHCGRCKRALNFEFEKCPYDGDNLRIAPGNPAP